MATINLIAVGALTTLLAKTTVWSCLEDFAHSNLIDEITMLYQVKTNTVNSDIPINLYHD